MTKENKPRSRTVTRAPMLLEWSGKHPIEKQPGELKVISEHAGSSRGTAGLILNGDNRAALQALLPQYRGKASLVYADPPYGVGAQFYAKASGTKKRVRAYHDADEISEVQALYELFFLLHELLNDRGTLWVQCDWRRSAVIRLLLDEVFGPERFLNHVVWMYKTGGVSKGNGFARKHDDILVYAKSAAPFLKPHRQKSYVPTLPEPHTPSGKRLGVRRDSVCDLCGNGAPGQKFRWVIGRDVWDDIPSLFRNDREIVGYQTQKPERLIERIITCASKPGDLVIDPFSGSGTTAATAERLGRRWIVCDKSAVAIRTTLRRMIKLPRRRSAVRLCSVAPKP